MAWLNFETVWASSFENKSKTSQYLYSLEIPAKVRSKASGRRGGGGRDYSNSSIFTLSTGKRERRNHPICGDITLIYTYTTRTGKRSYRVGVSRLSTDTTSAPILINHLYSFSIGAARGAENDPISTVRLRSLTWRLYRYPDSATAVPTRASSSHTV